MSITETIILYSFALSVYIFFVVLCVVRFFVIYLFIFCFVILFIYCTYFILFIYLLLLFLGGGGWVGRVFEYLAVRKIRISNETTIMRKVLLTTITLNLLPSFICSFLDLPLKFSLLYILVCIFEQKYDQNIDSFYSLNNEYDVREIVQTKISGHCVGLDHL